MHIPTVSQQNIQTQTVSIN